jgi:isoleucyl-tRNA synthetase
MMGYWVDLEHPYITFDNKYIETVWHLLSKLYEKGLAVQGLYDTALFAGCRYRPEYARAEPTGLLQAM